MLIVATLLSTLILAGLWIGAAVSNTSHSNKAGSSTVKRARLTGIKIKVDSGVATISIKNFPIGLHVMYRYFPDTPRTERRIKYTLSHQLSACLLSILFKNAVFV
jgi:hypothetical protein